MVATTNTMSRMCVHSFVSERCFAAVAPDENHVTTGSAEPRGRALLAGWPPDAHRATEEHRGALGNEAENRAAGCRRKAETHLHGIAKGLQHLVVSEHDRPRAHRRHTRIVCSCSRHEKHDSRSALT